MAGSAAAHFKEQYVVRMMATRADPMMIRVAQRVLPKFAKEGGMSHSIPRSEDWSTFAFDEAFDEIELRPLMEAEYEAANQQHEIWLGREQAERAELALSLEEELEALIATLERGAPAEKESATSEPANWPDL